MADGRRSGQNGPCSQSGNHFKVGVDQSNPNTCIARGREVQALLKQLLLANFSLFNMCWWLVASMCDLCVVVVFNTQLEKKSGSTKNFRKKLYVICEQHCVLSEKYMKRNI